MDYNILWKILLNAIGTGLIISISPGAALFGIIQTSLSKGFKSGVFFALGIALSDMIPISLCLFGFSAILGNPLAQQIFGAVCGSILVGYGLITFFSRRDKVSEKQRMQVENRIHEMDDKIDNLKPVLPRRSYLNVLKPMSKGFLFNFLNPVAWILWVGILPVTASFSLKQQIFFFGSILATIFCIDVLKSFFAGKIKNMVTPKIFFYVNRIIGIVFCVLGVLLILDRCFGVPIFPISNSSQA